jgi:2-iminobutanoate/2-iminopropanoate deaminase
MLRAIETAGAPRPIGPYSQAIAAPAAGLVFTAGMVGNDPASGQLVPGGIAAETERALDNLEAVLAAAGLSFADVVKTTVYLLDLADFPAMNAVYAHRMGENRPARATVGVSALPIGARVEIDMVAAAHPA